MLEKSLAGPLGLIVKVSTLQEYGVDKFFFLENDNADTSQHNVIFIARGECARHAHAIARKIYPPRHLSKARIQEAKVLMYESRAGEAVAARKPDRP